MDSGGYYFIWHYIPAVTRKLIPCSSAHFCKVFHIKEALLAIHHPGLKDALIPRTMRPNGPASPSFGCTCSTFTFLNHTQKLDRSGVLFAFLWAFTLGLFELCLSVVRSSGVAPWGGTPLSSAAVKQPPLRWATVQILRFCTCFQDNWHLKGQRWLLTVCPSLAFGSDRVFLFQAVAPALLKSQNYCLSAERGGSASNIFGRHQGKNQKNLSSRKVWVSGLIWTLGAESQSK